DNPRVHREEGARNCDPLAPKKAATVVCEVLHKRKSRNNEVFKFPWQPEERYLHSGGVPKSCTGSGWDKETRNGTGLENVPIFLDPLTQLTNQLSAVDLLPQLIPLPTQRDHRLVLQRRVTRE